MEEGWKGREELEEIKRERNGRKKKTGEKIVIIEGRRGGEGMGEEERTEEDVKEGKKGGKGAQCPNTLFWNSHMITSP